MMDKIQPVNKTKYTHNHKSKEQPKSSKPNPNPKPTTDFATILQQMKSKV